MNAPESQRQVAHSGTQLLITSHSIDNTFDYCARKFEFTQLYAPPSQRESGFAADVGTALHEAVGAWLIARAEGLSEAVAVERGFKALLLWYPWDREYEQATSVRDIHRTIAMLDAIMSAPEWDNWELMRVDNGKWAVEVPFLIRHTSLGEFTVKNTGQRALLCTQGKIDFILRHKVSGEIRSWDLKTTTLQIELVRSEYKYSGQQTGYSHIVHSMLGVAPDKFSVWYMVARFSATDPPQVQAFEMERGQDMIDDYWMTKLERLYRMKHYAETGWFPRTNGGCNAWGRECHCFSVCPSRDPEFIKRWFEFDVDPENPFVPQGYDWWVELEL